MFYHLNQLKCVITVNSMWKNLVDYDSDNNKENEYMKRRSIEVEGR